ncbi:unnamed protein product [Closterium sp. NIES-54]
MLVNGWMGAGIDVVSGVRQGCPLAPYLFLCAVEPLVQKVEKEQLGLDIAGQRLTYIGYADDTTLALQGKEQIAEAEVILDELERQFGLATNKAKMVILSLGANLGRDDGGAFKWAKPKDAERLLGGWVTPDGSGLPTWEKAMDDIKKRLGLWRQKFLTEKARGSVANSYIQPVMIFQAQVYPPPATVWREVEKMIHNFVSGNKATTERVFLVWSTELLYTLRQDGGLGVHDPNVTLACLAARRVGLMMTEVNQLKRGLMVRAADLPLGLDTLTAHDRLLWNWEGRSQRWRQTCELFMKSPISVRTVEVTWAEIAKERIVFNRAIMVGTTTLVGGQKAAGELWDWTLGDLVVRQHDGASRLKTMEELTEELGGKGPARLALRAFIAAPTEWMEELLTPCTNSAVWGTMGGTKPPCIPILEDGEVISLKRMREQWKGKRAQSHRMLRWAGRWISGDAVISPVKTGVRAAVTSRAALLISLVVVIHLSTSSAQPAPILPAQVSAQAKPSASLLPPALSQACPHTGLAPSATAIASTRCPAASAQSCCGACADLNAALGLASASLGDLVSLVSPEALSFVQPSAKACDAFIGQTTCLQLLEDLTCALTCNPDCQLCCDPHSIQSCSFCCLPTARSAPPSSPSTTLQESCFNGTGLDPRYTACSFFHPLPHPKFSPFLFTPFRDLVSTAQVFTLATLPAATRSPSPPHALPTLSTPLTPPPSPLAPPPPPPPLSPLSPESPTQTRACSALSPQPPNLPNLPRPPSLPRASRPSLHRPLPDLSSTLHVRSLKNPRQSLRGSQRVALLLQIRRAVPTAAT